MPDYRAYLIGPNGHFCKAVALNVPDKTAAIAAAEQLVDGHDVELWQGDKQDRQLRAEETFRFLYAATENVDNHLSPASIQPAAGGGDDEDALGIRAVLCPDTQSAISNRMTA